MTIFKSKKTSNASLPTYVLVHFLTWSSIFPLMKIYLIKGSFVIYYYHASSGGFQLAIILRKLGLLTQEPERIKYVRFADLPQCQVLTLRHLVFRSCSTQLKKIERITKQCFPFLSSSEKKFYAVNVRKAQVKFSQH